MFQGLTPFPSSTLKTGTELEDFDTLTRLSAWKDFIELYVGGLISFASTAIFLFALDISG